VCSRYGPGSAVRSDKVSVAVACRRLGRRDALLSLRSNASDARSQGAMSSDTIAQVLSLYRKADELERKGHLLRSADYYSRAAEAAGDLGPDNLVATYMQQYQAAVLRNYVVSVATTNTRDSRD